MRATYIPTTNATGTALGLSTQNVELTKILIGAPVASANIYIFEETNPGSSSNTTGLKAKLTLPGSFATGQLPFTIDLTDEDGHGIILSSGGSIIIDQTLQLTAMWAEAAQESNTV
ncbi:MAG: hypothetical protein PHE73_08810 [Sulfurovaceae bacterium]|nr:hypothetical protein [Sulfurovaceae bacterium]